LQNNAVTHTFLNLKLYFMRKIFLTPLFAITIIFSVCAQVDATKVKITLLRIHDVGTKYGPPSDQIDVEVIVTISSKPGNAFGFKLRKDDNEIAHQAMYELLKDAFKNNKDVRIEYYANGAKKNLVLFRVIMDSGGGLMQ